MERVINFFAPHIWPLVYALVIVAILPLLAGYVVLMERKVMADMQARLGPMRVGPHGLLQPLADALKLLIKEDIIPDGADKVIFWMAPMISVTAAMLAFSALAFGPVFQIADLNIGLLFIAAISAMGVYGIVLGGWSSNSHYSLLGALRSTAQVISYETAAGMALVGGVLLAGSLSMKEIVAAQAKMGVWFVFLAPVGCFIYLVASIAETNRAPFDMPEAESELVAGYMTEYSGFRWAIYFLAEYCNMIVVSSIAVTLFLGGWQRPFAGVALFDFLDFLPPLFMLGGAGYCFYRITKHPHWDQKAWLVVFGGLLLALGGALALPFALPATKAGIHGGFWFLLKVAGYLYAFLWIRFTFPRYRFDQLMRLGWQFLIPVSIVNVVGIGAALILARPASEGGLGVPMWASFALMNLVVLGIAAWLITMSGARQQAVSEAKG